MFFAYKYSAFRHSNSRKMQKNVEKKAFSAHFIVFVSKKQYLCEENKANK